jgi:hypothetical protein
MPGAPISVKYDVHSGFVGDQRSASPVPLSSSSPAPVAW